MLAQIRTVANTLLFWINASIYFEVQKSLPNNIKTFFNGSYKNHRTLSTYTTLYKIRTRTSILSQNPGIFKIKIKKFSTFMCILMKYFTNIDEKLKKIAYFMVEFETRQKPKTQLSKT